MKSLLIHTTPQQRALYAVKRHEGEVFPLPFHAHERFELTCILKGAGTRIIGDKVAPYKSGDIVLLAPHTPHQWQTELRNKATVLAISVFFSEHFPTKDFQNLPEFKAIADLLELAKFGIELKGNLRKNIAEKMQQLSPDYSLRQLVAILKILDEIALSGEYNVLLDKGFAIQRQQDKERITDLVKYIRTHISQKITVAELAEKACMHPGSVNRFFKKSTGFTLVEYINLTRIGLACQLLTETHRPILDIALECGFNNLSNFNRIFKRTKGTTPTNYRKIAARL